MMRATPVAELTAQAKYKQEMEKMLKDNNVKPGTTAMAPKKPPGTKGVGEARLVTNMYLLDLLEQQQLYRYEVNIEGVNVNQEGENPNPMTKHTANDYRLVDRRNKCRDIMFRYEAKNTAAFRETHNLLYYDLSRTLFALKPLEMQNGSFVDRYGRDELPENNATNGLPHYQFYDITIRPVTDAKSQFTIGDFDFVTDDAAKIDRSLEQFLDIATSQHIFKNPDVFTSFSTALGFLLYPGHHGFCQTDCPHFDTNDSFLGIGIAKGVRMIQNDGQPSAAVFINAKKTPFHVVGYLYDKALSYMENRDLTNLSNGAKNTLKENLRDNNARIQRLPPDSQNPDITVEEYYRKQYNIHLEHPLVPLIIRRDKEKNKYYPMELLIVCDNQRVKTPQTTSSQIAEMIRKCAVDPAVLLEQNEKVKRTLQLSMSEHLDRASVRFHNEPITVNGRILPPPDIEYAGRTTVKPRPGVCNWNDHQKYLIPAKCEKWCAYALVEGNELSDQQWKDFVKLFLQTARSKGMSFPEATDILVLPAKQNIEKLLKDVYNKGCDFMLLAHPNDADSVHHEMKLNERITEVVTQGLKMDTVRNVLNKKPLALTNIVHKTNVKLGGLNHTLSDRELYTTFKDTLFIGFSMNHPGGGAGMAESSPKDSPPKGQQTQSNSGTNGNVGKAAGPSTGSGTGQAGQGQSGSGGSGQQAAGQNGNGPGQKRPSPPQTGSSPQQQTPKQLPPSILGYAANIGPKNHFEFIGDYKFQEACRDERVELIIEAVLRCATEYKNRDKKYPVRIVIFRNACGEGYYQNLLRYEVPMVKHALASINCTAKLTLFVVNKHQPILLFPSNINKNAKPSDQNIKPGTVVDTTIVHPKWTEFFLASHCAIQGTARVPRYNALLDENEFTMDQLEELPNILCYFHQIIPSPTSLPTPVFVAEEYAKRGRNNYNTEGGGPIPAVADPEKYYAHLTQRLGFQNTNYLSKLRVNA